jgi:cell division protein FtsX
MAALQSIARRLRPGWIFLFAAALPFLASTARAQSAADPRSAVAAHALSIDDSGFVDASTADQAKNRMLREMALQRDELRQKDIVDDTNRLMQLVKKLKTAVDKSDKDHLSLAVVHTAAQIEKLAKTIKQKMREPE